MPRSKLPAGERKERITIRLPYWMIEAITDNGTLQEVIEGILRKHVKRLPKSTNSDIDKPK